MFISSWLYTEPDVNRSKRGRGLERRKSSGSGQNPSTDNRSTGALWWSVVWCNAPLLSTDKALSIQDWYQSELYRALPELLPRSTGYRLKKAVPGLVGTISGLLTTGVEALSDHLQRKRQNAINKAVTAMATDQDMITNRLKQFEGDMIMYGEYNIGSQEKSIETLNDMHSRVSILEGIIQGAMKGSWNPKASTSLELFAFDVTRVAFSKGKLNCTSIHLFKSSSFCFFNLEQNTFQGFAWFSLFTTFLCFFIHGLFVYSEMVFFILTTHNCSGRILHGVTHYQLVEPCQRMEKAFSH